MITKEIKDKAKELLGIDNFSQEELRLVPYISYVMHNSRDIDARKIDRSEIKILLNWESKGFISVTPLRVMVTKKFWDAMQEILWLSYVNYDETNL